MTTQSGAGEKMREAVARAICKATDNELDPDSVVYVGGGIDETLWRAYLPEADAAIAALSASQPQGDVVMVTVPDGVNIFTADQLGDIEMTAMNGFGHDNGAKRESVYRIDIMDLLAHIEAISTLALASAPQAPAAPVRNGWRGMESAPKDGTPMLVWCAHMNRCVIIEWPRADENWDGDAIDPTHWMPLPPPPAPDR